ncbi:MAG: flagellar hook-basal body complex protein FliE [Bacillota bacterium]
MDAIRSLNIVSPATASSAATTKSVNPETGFGEVLKAALKDVNQLQLDADTSARELLLGRVDMHQAMIAMEKANLAMDLTIQVRNKLIEAYQEIMRMQI